jgi:hypothetical protein
LVLLLVAVAVLLVGLLWLTLYAVRHDREEKRDALVARADQQHTWVLAGDDRGIYGDYRPESFS